MFRSAFTISAVVFFAFGPAFTPITWASTCTGDKNCRACSNCSRCAHCSSGGKCGVCAGGGSSKAFDDMIHAGVLRDRAAYAARHPQPKPTPKFDPSAFHALHAKRTIIVAQQAGLRKTAKDTSARLQLLKKGATVIVLGMQAGHYKTMLLDGKTGYVPKSAVGGIDEVLTVKR